MGFFFHAVHFFGSFSYCIASFVIITGNSRDFKASDSTKVKNEKNKSETEITVGITYVSHSAQIQCLRIRNVF